MKSLADMTELESLSYVGKSVRYRLVQSKNLRMVEVVLLAVNSHKIQGTRRGKPYELAKRWAIVRPIGVQDSCMPVNAQRLFPYDVPDCLQYRSPTQGTGMTHLVRYEGNTP